MNDIYVPSEGPERAEIMIVGEAPGRQEVVERRPFVGPAGNLLREALLRVGINPYDVYFTNLAKYQPPRNELAAWGEVNSGLPAHPNLALGVLELQQEIQRVRPNVIIPVGAAPTFFLSNGCKWNRKEREWTGISEWRGAVEHGAKLAEGFKVIPTLHPAYCLRVFEELSLLEHDLAKAKRLSLYPEVAYPDVERFIDPQGPERAEVRQRLLDPNAPPIVVDIEYSRSSKRLYCVGFTTHSSWAATIVIRTAADIAWVRDIVCSGRPLVAQNAMFDFGILEWWHNMACIQHCVYDTMIAAHAANIELKKDLGFLCRQHTDYRNYWSEFDGQFWSDVEKGWRSPDEMLHYNNDDVWVTAAVREAQIAHEMGGVDPWDTSIDASIKRDLFGVRWAFRHEMQLLHKLWPVSKRGVRMDTDGIANLKRKLQEEGELYQLAIDAIHGGPLNVKSQPQVARFLYDELGLPAVSRTKAGKRATDDITLAKLELLAKSETQRTIVRNIRERRNRLDLISKFCEIELDHDSRMRCTYNPAGTDTGRLASKAFVPTDKGTNMQNPPRLKIVRQQFLADSGKEMGYADLERAESVVVMHLTQDEEMFRIHRPGLDAHKITAARIYYPETRSLAAESIDVSMITKDQRAMGKEARHAGNYMLGWKQFMDRVNKKAKETGITITAAQAKEIISTYRAMHPGLGRWWRETEDILWRERRLYNLLGRKRDFYGRISNILPSAIAFKPQSTVGDALNVALITLLDDDELRRMEFEILMQVHDAVVYQYPKDLRFEVNSRVRNLMRVPLVAPKTRETFIIPVEIQVGPSWGSVELWQEDIAHA